MGQQKRASYTAPKALLEESRKDGGDDDVDPFEAHRKARIADREDEYR